MRMCLPLGTTATTVRPETSDVASEGTRKSELTITDPSSASRSILHCR